MNQIDKLTQEAVCGGGAPIATGYNKSRVYKDGKATDESDGVRVGIVGPGRDFTPVSVKLPEGGVELGGMTNDDISAANAAGKYVYVGLDGFAAKAYVGRDGNLGITATATRVFLTDANSKAKGTIPGGVSHV